MKCTNYSSLTVRQTPCQRKKRINHIIHEYKIEPKGTLVKPVAETDVYLNLFYCNQAALHENLLLKALNTKIQVLFLLLRIMRPIELPSKYWKQVN